MASQYHWLSKEQAEIGPPTRRGKTVFPVSDPFYRIPPKEIAAEEIRSPQKQNLASWLMSYWENLTPEERLIEAISLITPYDFAAMGAVGVARGGQRFFSYLTDVLEQATKHGKVGNFAFPEAGKGSVYLSRLKKLGVSPDDLKYSGVESFLQRNENREVTLSQLATYARENELKLKAYDLPYGDRKEAQFGELIEGAMRIKDKGLEFTRKDELNPGRYTKQIDALRTAEQRQLSRGAALLNEKRQPTHLPQDYLTLKYRGDVPLNYRERVYEVSAGGDVFDVGQKYTHHKGKSDKIFAFSRGHDRTVLTPQGEHINVTHLDIEQADVHQKAVGYIDYRDPKAQEKSFFRGVDEYLKRYNSTKHETAFAIYSGTGGVSIQAEGKGFRVGVTSPYTAGTTKPTLIDFKDIKDLEKRLPGILEEAKLPYKSLVQQGMGRLEAAGLVAQDFPFKKDWHKVITKDWLKQAAEEGKQGLTFPTWEVMKRRQGYAEVPTGSKFVVEQENILESALVHIEDPRGRDYGSYTFDEFAEEFGKPAAKEIFAKDGGILTEPIPEKRGLAHYDLYEKRIPKFIEQEFGIKPRQMPTEVWDSKWNDPKDAVQPVWFVPITDELKEKLSKPLRLSKKHFMQKAFSEFA
jgi:hypothetical protein